MMTASADSMALSVPLPPIAIPTSALVRQGASLIPSPTKTTPPPDSDIICSKMRYLSSGISSEYTLSTLSSLATAFTSLSRSPERIYALFTPSLLSSFIASSASLFTVSLTKIAPINSPFFAT